MMIFDSNILLPGVTILAAAGFAVGCLRMRAQIHRERAHDLRIAKIALDDFYNSVNLVVTDPAVSDDLKLMLLTMSEAMPDRAAANYLVKELLGNGFERKQKWNDSEAIVKEFRLLAKSRPDLMEEITKAYKAGMVALILRWPETASQWKAASAVLTDERAEIAAAKRVSRFAVEHPRKRDHGADDGGLVAA